jgi:hypothetical protein
LPPPLRPALAVACPAVACCSATACCSGNATLTGENLDESVLPATRIRLHRIQILKARVQPAQ